ncbi:MAG: hypothetical protein WCO62_10560, partial [Betaproteobacteria bacterium]
ARYSQERPNQQWYDVGEHGPYRCGPDRRWAGAVQHGWVHLHGDSQDRSSNRYYGVGHDR